MVTKMSMMVVPDCHAGRPRACHMGIIMPNVGPVGAGFLNKQI